MTRTELIEVMARAIWDERCRHWGKYRKHLHEPDSEGYDWGDLGLSKRKELLREAAAVLTAIEAAGMRVVPEDYTPANIALRDAFIVREGLWQKFIDHLSSAAQEDSTSE